jgi:hypothetical protein
MARRRLLSDEQLAPFWAWASDERAIVRHYTLSLADLDLIAKKRTASNRTARHHLALLRPPNPGGVSRSAPTLTTPTTIQSTATICRSDLQPTFQNQRGPWPFRCNYTTFSRIHTATNKSGAERSSPRHATSMRPAGPGSSPPWRSRKASRSVASS